MDKVKLFVGYLKNTQRLEGSNLEHIQLGAENNPPLSWVEYKDNTGDNISLLNNKFCEITGIYWIWKNYKNLDNLEYVGFQHYRRVFDFTEINEFIKDYDMVVPVEELECSLEEQFVKYHGEENLILLKNVFSELYSEEINTFCQYLREKVGYFYNIFIFKTDLFKEYCEFLFPILFNLEQKINYEELSEYNQRMIGFFSERITGYFIYKKKLCNNTIKEVKIKFLNNVVVLDEAVDRLLNNSDYLNSRLNIVTTANNAYVAPLAAMISSLIKNSGESCISVWCLYTDISYENIKLLKLAAYNSSAHINFVNINSYVRLEFLDNLKTCLHCSKESNYRLFAPIILKNAKRILWLDSDVIVNHDIVQLYNLDLQTDLIGATKDIEMHRQIRNNEDIKKYLETSLNINFNDYFQAGVILFNNSKIDVCEYTTKLNNYICNEYIFGDQDVLNMIFKNRVKWVDNKWNYDWHIKFMSDNLKKELTPFYYNLYIDSKENFAIIHYASIFKPWHMDNRDESFYFWKYLRDTPFYESVLCSKNNRLNSILESQMIFNDYIAEKFSICWSVLNKFKILLKFFRIKI